MEAEAEGKLECRDIDAPEEFGGKFDLGVPNHGHLYESPWVYNLWLGYAYCVKVVGNIQTYPGYPVVVPSTIFTWPPVATETSAPPVFDLPALNPRAPGTADGCDSYENAWPEAITAQNPNANACAAWANMGDGCWDICGPLRYLAG
ncbi:hypothetical protein F5144DRAFT_629038 [Chaetomium tenue]|uniref:Uncharacterized protein n=1 Tax=Chaetomium tenue TaxID=1854479 RepID=A0ACB7PE29_9PEZI|nr:hypothetical protein F5144DRAFT_629038 [Chaetomium globosum]